MDTATTNSDQVQSTPDTSLASSPAQSFGDDVPNWVKTAGLMDAHKAAKPGVVNTAPPKAAPGAVVIEGQETVKPTTVQPTTDTTTSTPVTTVPPVVPPTPSAFDEAKLAQAITQGIRAGQAPTPTGPSDAELAKQLGIFTATPEIYKSILGVEPTDAGQVTALNNALQAVARQSVQISQVLQNQAIKDLEAKFMPYINVIRSNEATRVREGFFKTHTDLSGYEPLVKQTYEAVLASGQKFPNLETASQFVAERTREMLKQVGITPTAPAAAGTTQVKPRTTTPPARTMSTTSMGGRTGTTPAAKPAGTMQSVWGN